MDRRFWEKIIPASVLAVGIAAAGYFVGGRHSVVETGGGSAFVVDRFSGAVRICAAGAEAAECVDEWVTITPPAPAVDEWGPLTPPAPAVPQ